MTKFRDPKVNALRIIVADAYINGDLDSIQTEPENVWRA
jgi:hypothetical protein